MLYCTTATTATAATAATATTATGANSYANSYAYSASSTNVYAFFERKLDKLVYI